MADNYRYRYGDTNPVNLPIKLGVAISIGDLCYEDSADSYTVKPASSLAFAAGLADPTTAPTVAAAAGSPAATQFGAGAWKVTYTYVYPWGESAPATQASVTLTSGQGISVTGITQPPAPAIGVNWYVSKVAADSVNLLLVAFNQGGSFSIEGPPALSSQLVPSSSQGGAFQQTQYNFAQLFVGQSGQRYDGSNPVATTGSKDGTIRIDTTGVFEFDCASASFNAGDLVGPDNNGGTALYTQQVVKVASKYLAIGRVEKTVASVTKVKVRLFGQKHAPFDGQLLIAPGPVV